MKRGGGSIARACAALLLAGALILAEPGYAIDSYRYLHVSIETPWMIFLFLLAAVFVPFVLMVVLMWRGALRKPAARPKPKSADHDA